MGMTSLWKEYERLMKIKNKAERRFVNEALDHGFIVLRLGVLDFMICNPDTKSIYIVEVKQGGKKLTDKQWFFKVIFEERFNIPVYVSRDGEFPKEIAEREREIILKMLMERMGVAV